MILTYAMKSIIPQYIRTAVAYVGDIKSIILKANRNEGTAHTLADNTNLIANLLIGILDCILNDLG